MKKKVEFYEIPDLFVFEPSLKKGRKGKITEEIHPEMAWVFQGEGVATVKYDGVPCAIIDGQYYRNYKPGRSLEGAIPWNDFEKNPKPEHYWIPVDPEKDLYHMDAFYNTDCRSRYPLPDGTYELIGAHFCRNPYQMDHDILVPHGKKIIDRTFASAEEIRSYLGKHQIEGIVFWKDGKPQCKVTRRDYGIKWPLPKKQGNKRK